MHGSCLTTQCSPTYPWDLFSRGELIVVLIRGQKGWTTKKDQSTFNLQTSSILHCYLWSRSKVNSGYVDRFLSFLDRVSISSLPRECHVNQECILFGKLQRRYLSYGPAFSFYSLDLTRNQGRNECPVSAARSWYFMSGSKVRDWGLNLKERHLDWRKGLKRKRHDHYEPSRWFSVGWV